jgi:hypothetical protein
MKLYAVVYKSSGVVAARFTHLAAARYFVEQNDTLYAGKDTEGSDDDGILHDAGMYKIINNSGKIVK